MKTILIPVDFSETSTNALQYAAGLIPDIKAERIILLKSFYISMYEQLLPSPDFVQLSAENIEEERQKIAEQLKSLSDELLGQCNSLVKIETIVSDLPLLRAIHQCIAAEKPDLLMVGSDHISSIGETYLGAQVIAIAKSSPIPVLIIPADVRYQHIKRALVPCDFNTVSRLSLLDGLDVLSHQLQRAELMVLNVDPQQQHLTHEQEHKDALKEVLENYKYKVYYSQDQNTVEGILAFARTHDVQLIVTLPGKYSFFYKLTHRSITDALALNAHQGVLILK